MRGLFKLTAASLAALAVVHVSNAQDGPPTWAPVEIFGCDFVDGADMDDLNGVIAQWNAWADENGTSDYTAFVLTPQFTAASFPYDVGWLGVWEDGAAIAGMQQWLTEGAEVNEAFGDVIDCPLHQALAITQVRDIGDVAEGNIVPVEFTDCTIREGRTGAESRAAIIAFTEFMADNGSQAGHWMLRPGPGEEPDATYSFKWLSAYTSYADLGHAFEVYYNGGGAGRLNDLTGRIFSCDHARIYDSRMVRAFAEGSD